VKNIAILILAILQAPYCDAFGITIELAGRVAPSLDPPAKITHKISIEMR